MKNLILTTILALMSLQASAAGSDLEQLKNDINQALAQSAENRLTAIATFSSELESKEGVNELVQKLTQVTGIKYSSDIYLTIAEESAPSLMEIFEKLMSDRGYNSEFLINPGYGNGFFDDSDSGHAYISIGGGGYGLLYCIKGVNAKAVGQNTALNTAQDYENAGCYIVTGDTSGTYKEEISANFKKRKE